MAEDTKAPNIASGTMVCLIVSFIVTVLRVYTRVFITRSFALEDWLAVLAQLFFIAYCTFVMTGISYGTGQHMSNLTTENTVRATHMWWCCEPMYVLTTAAIKASICIFLLRICITRVTRIIVYVVLVVTEVYSLFFLLIFILQCRPTSLFWLQFGNNPPDGYCLNLTVVVGAFYGYSVIGCITDWTCCILPIFLVWDLQMSTRVKISVVGLLATGAIASTATIVRFPYIPTMYNTTDFLYATWPVAVWSVVEAGLGITAAGLATLRPLMRAVLGSEGSSGPSGPSGPSGHGFHQTGNKSRATKGSRIGRRTVTRHGDVDEELGIDMDDHHGHHGDSKEMGITTIVDRGSRNNGKKNSSDDDSGSDTNPFASSQDGAPWGSSGTHYRHDGGSQSDLDDARALDSGLASPSEWNIKVTKSVVQTHSSGN